MCKNNFTNENEFDFSGVMPDSVFNPSGPSNCLGIWYNQIIGCTTIITKILMYLEMLQDLIQISDYKYIYILFKLIIISFIL